MGILLVIVLFFADDLLIVAESPEELQFFLDLLHAFCTEIKLTVNVTKTMGMVFNGGKSTYPDVCYNGAKLQFVEKFKYLGVVFDARKGVKASLQYVLGAGKRAVHAVHTGCSLVGIKFPAAKCKMFDTKVMPILTYASEVWAVYFCTDCSWDKCLENEVERVHFAFLRQLFGIRTSTHRWMLLREYGRLPVFFFWWSRVIKFLGKVHKLGDACPLKQAYLEEIELLVKGKACWLGRVRAFLISVFGGDFPTERGAIRVYLGALSVSRVRKAMVDRWKIFWSQVANGGVHASKCLFYDTHVAHDAISQKYGWYSPAPHFFLCMAGDIHSNLVRCRVGNLDILTERQRWLRVEQRATFDCRCTSCSSGEVEDEHHFLFHCVRYENIRMEDKYMDIFMLSSGSIKSFFNYSNQVKLARLVSEMLMVRVK